MDRTSIFRGLLGEDQDFGQLQPAEQKIITETAIIRIIDAIEAEGREPDSWESSALLAAMSAAAATWYVNALKYITVALTPPRERHPGPHVTVAQLRATLSVITGLPARSA